MSAMITDIKGGVTPEDTRIYWEIEDMTSIEFTMADQPGNLMKALDIFNKN